MSLEEIKRISFSELKNWKECSFRHKLIYVDKLPYFSGNEFTAFGTAIHTACESIKEDTDLYDIFRTSFGKELSTLQQEGHDINKELALDMADQARPICKELFPAMKSYFGDFSVVAIEELLLEDIKEFDASGRKFKGYIDIIIKSDNKYHIIDWKSCSWGWSSRKKAEPMVTSQLAYYKNYYSKKHNLDPKNIETYFVLLKRTAKSNNVEICRVTSGPKKIENSLKILENAVINIDNKNYIKNRLNCKYCKFHETEKCV